MAHIAPAFYIHASPDAIRHAIREAELTRDRYEKKASVLRGLLATRLDQIEAGTWPPRTDAPAV